VLTADEAFISECSCDKALGEVAALSGREAFGKEFAPNILRVDTGHVQVEDAPHRLGFARRYLPGVTVSPVAELYMLHAR